MSKNNIPITVRLPRPILVKLIRLSKAGFQTKSQYLTKLIRNIPEPAGVFVDTHNW